jgi:hypothetical protein
VRQAASASGVSPFLVRRWVSQGVLAEPPWTPRQLQDAGDMQDPGPRSQAAHGGTARRNQGCACAVCRRAHSNDARVRTRAKAAARLPVEIRQQLLDAICTGKPFRLALRDLALTPNQVWGLAQTDEAWSAALEAALMATRRSDLGHGTNAAYVAGCVCKECREHQRQRMARSSPRSRRPSSRTLSWQQTTESDNARYRHTSTLMQDPLTQTRP